MSEIKESFDIHVSERTRKELMKVMSETTRFDEDMIDFVSIVMDEDNVVINFKRKYESLHKFEEWLEEAVNDLRGEYKNDTEDGIWNELQAQAKEAGIKWFDNEATDNYGEEIIKYRHVENYGTPEAVWTWWNDETDDWDSEPYVKK